ncbi:endonuclease 8-like 1 isoform X2 [Pyrgilauda ruficollis]|uniref:endonuclease 8-like 1 isoform X2 n=1 Tax=Pyrgilauda ruficollis TaxID=221976 RepID=UPI001B88063C|nr:endonuclease 8-like 1 isoform X2 [Pyrgilauda ruficollis]
MGALTARAAANGSAHRPRQSQWERSPRPPQPMGAGRAAGGGGLGLCRAVATMPECPELHLAGRFINGACGALVFAGGVERSAVGRGPEVPFRSEAYSISAIARGKELRLTLSALNPAAGPAAQDLVFRFGMSGSFRLCPAAELPRHAHLRFLTRESPPRALCFVDPRRFGSWRLGDAWQPERGPCVVSEYQAFRENVLKNLDDRAFDKPICEVLLNQKYFNGIGNYLRAEILYRLKIPPFEKARTVLEALKEQEQERRKKDPSLTLSKKVKLRQENPDLLELCHSVPMEVIMAEKQLLDPEHPDNYATFKNWLQCYLVPGMSSLRDRSGRTIWFQGEPGPMAPKGQRPRKTPRKKSPQLKAEPEAASPKVTPRASKQRRRAAAKPLKSEEEEEGQEEQADGPRKGRARGRRTVAAAPASPEVPQSVRRSRRTSARRGRGAAPAV